MRTIKVYVDTKIGETTKGTQFDDWSNNFIIKLLQKHYHVVQSDEPDYIFFDETTESFYLDHNAIKIFFSFENIKPNFNLCDYAITLFDIQYQNRHFRIEPYMYDRKSRLAYDVLINKKEFTQKDLDSKKGFCAIVTSNSLMAAPERYGFFKFLSDNYKQVASGGREYNNVGGPVADKQTFLNQYKFSIAFENSRYYTTEKIYDAFAAHTIPIYWGDPDITNNLNPKSFINMHDFNTYDDALDFIKTIDNNDELYLDMINQPIKSSLLTSLEHESNLEEFLIRIIETPPDKAIQRDIRFPYVRKEEYIRRKGLSNFKRLQKINKFVFTIYRPFKFLFENSLGLRIRKFVLKLFGIAYS